MDSVSETIGKHDMLCGRETVLVALSGGPDSVCLLSVLNKLKQELSLTLHAVYVDHNLRPEEVPGEIAFCRDLCIGMGINFIVRSIDVKSSVAESGMNKQEAARELRYRAFDEACFEVNADRIALAHNADDQVETVVMRLLRGSGTKGLAGIPAVRKNIIRPLIETERFAIEKYLASEGLTFVTDSSNLKTDYFRNRIRRSLMPLLRDINPSVCRTITHTTSVLQEEERYFGIIVTKTLMKLISRKKPDRIELFISPLESMEKVILRRLLRRAVDETRGIRGIGFDHIEDIIKLIRKGVSGDRIYLPKGVRVIREYSLLVLTAETPVRINRYEISPPCDVLIREAGVVIRATFEDRPACIPDGTDAVVLDCGAMQFPLLIRPREEGDFFYPLGFGRRKKLQDFFVDAKVPRDERDRVPVICSGNEIVWIAGYRADERFRVAEKTEKTLKLVILKGGF